MLARTRSGAACNSATVCFSADGGETPPLHHAKPAFFSDDAMSPTFFTAAAALPACSLT
jgi:hypothetical protein